MPFQCKCKSIKHLHAKYIDLSDQMPERMCIKVLILKDVVNYMTHL
jgi:hypothetical protein